MSPKLTKQFTRNSRYERCPVGHVFVWSRYRFIRYNGRDTCSLVFALSDEGCFFYKLAFYNIILFCVYIFKYEFLSFKCSLH